MSILEAVEAEPQLKLAPMKELHHSCCTESDLPVYDFDGYAHWLGGKIPATMDGIWIGDLRDRLHLILIEMKSIQKMELNFHFQECAKDVRGSSPEETAKKCQPALKAFVVKKLSDYDYAGKLSGTQRLLCGLDAELTDDLKKGDVTERCFVACDLKFREFIAYRETFKAALKPLANDTWGEPTAIPCSRVKDEQALRSYFAG